MRYQTFTSRLLSLILAAGVALSVQAATLSGPAPDFTLPSNQGRNIKLSELRGNVVMINFWASWCGPCRQEMPLLEALYKKYEPLGFTILGVNVEEDNRAARKLLSQLKVSFPILFDTRNEVSKQYQLAAMPSTVLIDRNGQLRFLHRGYLPGYEKEYDKQISQLIRE